MKNKILPILLSFTLLTSFSIKEKELSEEKVTLSYETMVDKIKGGWLGALWGNFTGLPTEFNYINTPNPSESVEWKVASTYATDDDTSMEYTWLHMMEVYGVNDITYDDFVPEWIYHFQDYIWEGNYNARQLMLKGITPPKSGMIGVNSTAEAIDAQIECEILGMVTPGMLQNCYDRTKWWMACVGDGDVLENSAFYSMLVSEAFINDDIYSALENVRSYFDDNLKCAQIYDFVKDLHDEDPTDWRKARLRAYREFYTSYALDCNINFAMTLVALFYGNNSYEDTVQIGVLAGYDNDCNAATCGTILGVMKGYSGLPSDLKEQSGTYYRNTNRPGLSSTTIDDLAVRIANQAINVIEGAGGYKNGKKYTIYDSNFKANVNQNKYHKKIDSSDENIKYSNMYKFYNQDFYNENGYGSWEKDSSITYEFEGDEIAIYATTSINGGSFDIYVDDVNYGNYSLESEETFTVGSFLPINYGQVIRKIRNLGSGKHTIKIVSAEDNKWHCFDYFELPCSQEESEESGPVNIARTSIATPIASVYEAIGSGAGGGPISVINDGEYYKDNAGSSKQFDTFLGKDGGNYINKDYEDFVGYTFSEEVDIAKIVFNEGGHWGNDGGWFADGTLRIEVYKNDSWQEVSFSANKEYPNSNAVASFGAGGETFTFYIDVSGVTGVRLIGKAGGIGYLISVGELEVYEES